MLNRYSFLFGLNLFWFLATLAADPAAAQNETTPAEIFLEQAKEHLEANRIDSAVFYFDIAAYSFKDSGEYEQYAATLQRIADLYIQTEEYTSAKKNLLNIQSAVERFDVDREKLFPVYNHLFRVHFMMGEYMPAIQVSFSMLDLARDMHGEEHYRVARAYGNICGGYHGMGVPTVAVEYCEKSVALREKLGGNPGWIATGHNNLAILYRSLGRFQKSVQSHEQALTLFGPEPQASQQTIGIIGNLASTLLSGGNTRRAMEYLYQSRDMLDHLDSPSPSLTSHHYFTMGQLFLQTGDHEKSLDYYNRALDIRLGYLGEIHPHTATTYEAIGTVREGLGDVISARKYYAQSLEIRREFFDSAHPDLFDSIRRLGDIAIQTGDFEEAELLFSEGLVMSDEIWGEKSNRHVLLLNSLADLHLKQDDQQSALQHLEAAAELQADLFGEQNGDLAAIYRKHGKIYAALSLPDEADQFFRKSITANSYDFEPRGPSDLPELDDVISLTELQHTLRARLDLLRNRNANNDLLLKHYTLFADATSELRREYRSEESKIRLTETVYSVFENALYDLHQAYTESGNPSYLETAFNLSEQNRSALLRESISDVQAISYSGLPDSLLLREKDLSEQIRFYSLEQFKQEAEDRQDADFRSLLFDAREEFSQLVRHLEQNYPNYYELRHNNSSISPADIAGKLRDDELLISYFFGSNHLFAFAIDSQNLHFEKLDLTGTEEDILKLRRSLVMADPSGFIKPAYNLYQTLFSSFDNLLAEKSAVTIIPDGPLYTIPFEALLTSDTTADRATDFAAIPYLLKDVSISYQYSADQFLKREPDFDSNPFAVADTSKTRIAGFAPVFDGNSSGGESELTANKSEPSAARNVSIHETFFDQKPGNASPLPFSRDEISAISDRVESRGFTFDRFLDDEASKTNFLTTAENYSVLHIATHGILDDRHPSLSGLLFHDYPDAADDPILYSGELLGMRLNAGLVILSACETGTGRVHRGEGLMAMTRSWLYAGADELLVSLWKVYDEHTKNLMVAFYEELLEDHSTRDALRLAKLRMIEHETTSFPGFWSGFIHIGK